MKIVKEKFVNKDIYAKVYNRNLMVITLMIGTFISLVNQSVLATALPQIMKSFDISVSTGQWLTTAYMLVNAIMVPLTAFLMGKIPSKKLFLSSMLIFGVGTIICAFASNFEILLIARMVQAIGAGIMMPLITTVFMMIFPPEKKGMAMGLVGLAASFSPAIGPSMAGFIIDRWSWNHLFYIIIPIAVIDIILGYFFMKDVVPLKNAKIDILSIILSSVGLGAVLYGFSNAGKNGWLDAGVMVSIIAGLIVCALFVWRQLAMDNPMLELRVFKSKVFTLTTAIGCLLNVSSVGVGIIVPIFLQSILGKSAFTSGLVVLPGALCMAVMMLVSGRLYDKYGLKRLAIPGIILLVVSTLPFANLNKDTSLIFITVLYAIRFIAISLVLMPMQTEGMSTLSNKLLTHGSAVSSMTRQVAGSLGTSVLITIMSNVSTSNVPNKALAKTNMELYKSGMLDAAIEGMNATFMVCIFLTVVALVMTLFLKEKNKRMEFIKDNKEQQIA